MNSHPILTRLSVENTIFGRRILVYYFLVKAYISVILISFWLGICWDSWNMYLVTLIPKSIAIHSDLGPYNWGEAKCPCGCGYRREKQRRIWRKDALVGFTKTQLEKVYANPRIVLNKDHIGFLPECDVTWYYRVKGETEPHVIMFKNNVCVGAIRGQVSYTFH